MLSEAKRDRARHAQRAERSGGLQGVWGRSPQRGAGAEPRRGVRGAEPPENFAKIEVF